MLMEKYEYILSKSRKVYEDQTTLKNCSFNRIGTRKDDVNQQNATNQKPKDLSNTANHFMKKRSSQLDMNKKGNPKVQKKVS